MRASLAMGRAYLAFAREEPGLYAAMFEAGLRHARMTSSSRLAADRAFDVLQRAASALCRALASRPQTSGDADEPARLGAVARRRRSLRRGAPRRRRSCRSLRRRSFESAMLVYLRGLGILPPEGPAPALRPLRLPAADNILCTSLTFWTGRSHLCECE